MPGDENYDWRKIGDAAWQPRDSQGELVFDGRMWIFGGWFDSFSAPPRDVWSSPDGRNWSLIQPAAPWIHSDLPMCLTFQERMWLMGGWYNGRLPGCSASNQVWCSANGSDWELKTDSAGWSPRLAAGAVVFKDRMWILGGIENYYFGDDNSLKNDVWSSADGRHWEQVTERAPWAPRAHHQALVHDGRIWVLGGGNYVPNYCAFNDVWYSEDGAHWTQATMAAAWEARLWFSSVSYRNRMWVLGGWSKEKDNYGDVWHSRDGRDWKRLESQVIWKSRHEQSAFVFQDRLWIAGGFPRPKLSNEVWSLELPADF
jgi:hypothetical protein